MIDFGTIVSNWYFEAKTPEGKDFSPVGLYKTVKQELVDLQEVITIEFGFKNLNVAYHTQVFSGNFSFEVAGANFVQIDISSDDTATVSVGNTSVSSRLQVPASAQSAEIVNPPQTFSVSGTYNNIGGPYFLNVKIILKSNLKCCFRAFENTPNELEYSQTLAESERWNYLDTSRKNRSVFGSGEIVEIRLENAVGANLSDYQSSISGDCFDSSGFYQLNTRQTQNKTISIELTLTNGRTITKFAEIKIPEYELAEEISASQYVLETNGDAVSFPDNSVGSARYFRIAIAPKNVSFSELYIWEKQVYPIATGIFVSLPNYQTTHTPGLPVKLDLNNRWWDKAYYIILNPSSIPETTFVDENGNIGTLEWLCPIRWSFENPGTYNSDGDGSLRTRVQKTIVKFSGDEHYILVRVSKEF